MACLFYSGSVDVKHTVSPLNYFRVLTALSLKQVISALSEGKKGDVVPYRYVIQGQVHWPSSNLAQYAYADSKLCILNARFNCLKFTITLLKELCKQKGHLIFHASDLRHAGV